MKLEVKETDGVPVIGSLCRSRTVHMHVSEIYRYEIDYYIWSHIHEIPISQKFILFYLSNSLSAYCHDCFALNDFCCDAMKKEHTSSKVNMVNVYLYISCNGTVSRILYNPGYRGIY